MNRFVRRAIVAVSMSIGLAVGIAAAQPEPSSPIDFTARTEQVRAGETITLEVIGDCQLRLDGGLLACPLNPTTTSTMTTSTTTEPPTTTTTTVALPGTAWPGPDNTGWRGVLAVHDGDLNITQPGTVIDSLDVRGHTWVSAPGVVIRNSWLRNGVRVNAAGAGVVIEDTEIGEGDGTTNAGKGNAQFEEAVTPGGYTCRRCNVHGFADGFRTGTWGPSIIEQSWVHDLHLSSGAHNDGIQRYAPNAVVDDIVRGNFIDCFAWTPSGQRRQCTTAAIFYADGWRGTLLLEGNLLAGGGYTLRIHESGRATVRNNVWLQGTWSVGPLNTANHAPYGDWSNNRVCPTAAADKGCTVLD